MDETNGNVRIRWREDSIKCFLEACIQEVTKLGKSGGSLQKDSWLRVQKQLQEVCNLKVSQKQMRNEYDYLKGKYAGWVYLKGKAGHLYNPKTNTFNLTNQEWEDFLKEHPKAKILKSSPLIFPDLCSVLFKRTFVLGENRWSPSSNLSRPRVSSVVRNSPLIQPLQIEDIPSNGQEGGTKILTSPDIQPLPLQIANIPSNSHEAGIQILNSPYIQPQPLQIEDIPSNSQEGGIHILSSPNIQPQPLQIEDIPCNSQEGRTRNPSIQYSQSDTVVPSVDKERTSATNFNLNGKRPKKRGKTTRKASQLEEDMASALRAIAKSHEGPSQEECVEKLNQLGWATNSSSYVAALGIFCEGPSYRKGWMLLPIDNVELLKSWVASTGRKLGYL